MRKAVDRPFLIHDRFLEEKCVIEGVSILLQNRMKFIFRIELCAHNFYPKNRFTKYSFIFLNPTSIR